MPDDLSMLVAGIIIGGSIIIIGGLAVWILSGSPFPFLPAAKVESGFHNAEEWDVAYNDEGDIEKITVHRNLERY